MHKLNLGALLVQNEILKFADENMQVMNQKLTSYLKASFKKCLTDC